MNLDQIDIRNINLNKSNEKFEVEGFLKKFDLILEKDVDYTIALYDEDRIIGTGSLSGNVLKCIAVDSNYQGFGLTNRLITVLLNEQYDRGNSHLFIFTNPSNKKFFFDTGFYEIAEIDSKVTLLENDPMGIEKYINRLFLSRKDGNVISSIVMNCNPFTYGHQYLIENASRNSDVVHLFVVWEDKSIFPNEVRFNLIKSGISHLENVILHKGSEYIISNSTFPSYFIKEKNSIVNVHAQLDLKIFGTYIAPPLGINRRYIGEEPFDLVTNEYNSVMKNLLPNYDIEVIEIPRKALGGQIISASRVRAAIKEGKISILEDMVPSTTFDYLISDDAKPIIDKIIG
jgi:[citrate (pro-3S)-lyase] ligase